MRLISRLLLSATFWLTGPGAAWAQADEELSEDPPLGLVRPLEFGVGSSAALGTLTENFSAGALTLTAPGLPVLEGFWSTPLGSVRPVPGTLGNWTVDRTLNVVGSYTSYAFRDEELPISVHLRRDVRGALYIAQRFDQSRYELEAGLGYFLRYETGSHSVGAPEPSYPFAALRTFHGPLLNANACFVVMRLLPFDQTLDICLRGALDVRPLVIAAADRNVAPLPLLFGGGADGALELRFSAAALALGYRVWTLRGSGYDELYHGPMLTLR